MKRRTGNIPYYLAVAWLVFCATVALVSPWAFRNVAIDMSVPEALVGPSRSHWFGTDCLGRDLFARVVVGSTVSLGVSTCAVALALLLGTWLGAWAAYHGGWRERSVLAAVDLFLCFPAFFFLLAVMAVVGPGVWNLVWVLAATSWMSVARLVRAEVLTLKEREFVLASKAFGASDTWVLWKHLLPNALAPVRVSAVLGVSSAILLEAGLSFLGIGIQPPMTSWGNLLMEGKATLGAAWWLMFFPGCAIFLTVFSLNTLGDHLSHARHSS